MVDIVQWATVPACMTPSATTAKEAKFVTTAGIVKFEVGKSGSIVFVSAVTTSLPAGRYHLRAYLERTDPTESNREPGLLGTNAQLRRRHHGSEGIEDVLVIAGPPVLGGNGNYVVDSPGRDFENGIDLTDYFYWVQLELKQAQPATASTRNAVKGLRLL
jgi:hypothetical protein